MQAAMWFYEQGLFTDLGARSIPGLFSEGANRAIKDKTYETRNTEYTLPDEAVEGELAVGERGAKVERDKALVSEKPKLSVSERKETIKKN